jgi:hypothetical protein
MLSLSVLKSQYGSCSIFKPKLIIVLKLLKMVNFTNAELTDMVLLYGEALSNTVEARRLTRSVEFRIRGLFRQLFNDCVITENLIHQLMIWDVQEVTTFWK